MTKKREDEDDVVPAAAEPVAEDKYHGYSPAQIARIEAEINPPEPEPTAESAAIQPPEPEPEDRGRAA